MPFPTLVPYVWLNLIVVPLLLAFGAGAGWSLGGFVVGAVLGAVRRGGRAQA